MTIKSKNKSKKLKYIDYATISIKKSILLLKKLKPKKIKIIQRETKINLDEKINKIIFENLKKSKIPIISEENSYKKNNYIINSSESYWIVDPLDGSLNYLRKINYSSICISLVKNRKLYLSLIYNINDKDLYVAYKNNIYLNNKKVSFKRNFIDKKKSILATGYPNQYKFNKSQLYFKKFQKVRMIGCASLSMLGCMLGKFDWYHEKNIMLWDVTAGYHFNLINKCDVKKFNLTKLCQDVSLGYCR